MSNKKYIPLSIPNLNGKEWPLIKECLDTNWVSSVGPFVNAFELKLSQYVKAKHGVSCINGTAGLFIALKLCGVKAGDEVIVPTLTFIAPVNCIKYLGAEPVFMDCDHILNLDVEKLEDFCKNSCTITNSGLKNKASGKIIKAILPVHIFGNPCDMEQIIRISKKYKLKIVEDSTESLGSSFATGPYKGKFTGAIGDFGVYSFNGNKIITTGGGGMIVANNTKLAQKAKYLTNQAKDDPTACIHNEIGYNFRLTNIQAALGIAQLQQLNKFINIKKRNYAVYKKLLGNEDGIYFLDPPKGVNANHWFYSLIINEKQCGFSRQKLMQYLSEKKIETRPIWFLNHLQKPYHKNQAYKIEKAPLCWKQVLNLPCSTNLESNDIKYVVSNIKSLIQRTRTA